MNGHEEDKKNVFNLLNLKTGKFGMDAFLLECFICSSHEVDMILSFNILRNFLNQGDFLIGDLHGYLHAYKL